MTAETRLQTLEAVFASQVQNAEASSDDQRLDHFARTILAETVVDLGSENERIIAAGKQALALAKRMPPLRGTPIPLVATSGTLINAIIRAFLRAETDEAAKEFATALRTGEGLPPLNEEELGGHLDFGLKTQKGTDRLLDFVAQSDLAVTEGEKAVVRRMDERTSQTLPHKQRVFRARCLCAAKSGKFELIADACERAIADIDARTAAVLGINFSQGEARGEGPKLYQPPHLQLQVRASDLFEYSWHTSSDPSVMERNAEYYERWLDKAAEIVGSSIGVRSTRPYGVDLLVHLVEHKPLWGANAPIFPPILRTLERRNI